MGGRGLGVSNRWAKASAEGGTANAGDGGQPSNKAEASQASNYPGRPATSPFELNQANDGPVGAVAAARDEVGGSEALHCRGLLADELAARLYARLDLIPEKRARERALAAEARGPLAARAAGDYGVRRSSGTTS